MVNLSKAVPERLFVAVLHDRDKNLPAGKAKPMGAGLRWLGDWVFTCAHVVDDALKGSEQSDQNLPHWPLGAKLPIELGIETLVSAQAEVVAYYGPTDPALWRDTAILRIIPHGAMPTFDEPYLPTKFQSWEPGNTVGIYGMGVKDQDSDSRKRQGFDEAGRWVPGSAMGVVRGVGVQLDCDKNILRGFSGGPVFDTSRQQILGIVSARNKAEEYAYMTEGQYLQDALHQQPGFRGQSSSANRITFIGGHRPTQTTASRRPKLGIKHCTLFLDRQNLLDAVSDAVQYAAVVPVVLMGEEEDWHEGAAQRLLYEADSAKESPAAPATEHPVVVDWQHEGKPSEVLEALRNRVWDVVASGCKINWASEQWHHPLEEPVGNLFSSASSRLVVHYVLQQHRTRAADIKIVEALFNDWWTLGANLTKGRFIIVFSLKRTAASSALGFLSFWQKPLNPENFLAAVAVRLKDYAQDPQHRDAQPFYQKLLVQLDSITLDHVRQWLSRLREEYGMSDEDSEALCELVESYLITNKSNKFKPIKELIGNSRKFRDWLEKSGRQ